MAVLLIAIRAFGREVDDADHLGEAHGLENRQGAVDVCGDRRDRKIERQLGVRDGGRVRHPIHLIRLQCADEAGDAKELTLHHGHRVVFAFRVVAVVRDDSFAGAYEQIDEVPTHKPAASCDHDGAHTWPLTRDGNRLGRRQRAGRKTARPTAVDDVVRTGDVSGHV